MCLFLQSICPSLREKLSKIKAAQNGDLIQGKSNKCSVSYCFIFLSSLFCYCCAFTLTELTRFGNEMMLCKANDQDLIKVWSYMILSFIFYVRSRIEVTEKCFWKFALFIVSWLLHLCNNNAENFIEVKIIYFIIIK